MVDFFLLIDLKLKINDSAISTSAYIDSGAFNSIFNSKLANLLDIDYLKGRLVYPLGIGGHIKAYENEIILSIGNEEIGCKVLFSENIQFSFNLLGLNPLFNNFKVCFDNKNCIVSLEKL